MHPDPHFRWTDRVEIRAFIAANPFGKLFAMTPDGPRLAHVPVVWLDEARIGFHLSNGNAITPHLDGATALFVVDGPHGYVSPDWYGLPGQVPTWNYVAVELEGAVQRLPPGQLTALIDALSDAGERHLLPKPIWTRDKMRAGLFERMTGAVTGYTMAIADWRGTRKLGQNKAQAARAGAAAGLEAAGDHGIAALMRQTRQ